MPFPTSWLNFLLTSSNVREGGMRIHAILHPKFWHYRNPLSESWRRTWGAVDFFFFLFLSDGSAMHEKRDSLILSWTSAGCRWLTFICPYQFFLRIPIIISLRPLTRIQTGTEHGDGKGASLSTQNTIGISQCRLLHFKLWMNESMSILPRIMATHYGHALKQKQTECMTTHLDRSK